MLNCSALYHHINVRSDNRIFPCCRFKKPIAKFDGNLTLNSPEYDDLRKNFHKKLPECKKCFDEEKLGIKSLRQEFNERYDCEEIKLEHLEIGFDNICNLKCDPCWEEWSWQFGDFKTTEDIKNIPNTINKITFLGGEPLHTNRHYIFLKKLNRTNIEVIYTTNGTIFPKNQWIKLWDNLDKITFLVSIDGYGELNERVRYPSKWEEIMKTLHFLENRYNVVIQTVLHKNNIHGLQKLKKWIGDREWVLNVLTYPEKMQASKTDLENALIHIDTDKHRVPIL